MSGTEKALTSVTQVLSGYQPDFRVVDGNGGADAIERFTVLPARGMPRLLLPTKGPAMTTALKSFVGGHRWSGIAPSVLQIVSKTAGSTPVLSRDIALISDSGAPAPVRDLISEVLGRTDFHLAFRLSVGRPNAKTVAMAISEAGEPLCFAKFGSEDMTNSLVRFEGEVLTRFQGQDLPVVLPDVLHSDVWAGDHHVLITRPVKIVPLKRVASEAHRAADAFTALNGVQAQQLDKSDYWKRTLARIDAVDDHAINHSLLLKAKDRIEATWGHYEFDFGLAHGDWSRPNLGTLNGKVVALDWERCTDMAPRGADIAHFAVIEHSSSSSNRLLDLEVIDSHARHYLDEVGRSALHARPLIALDLLEMVLRFSTARAAGIPSKDSTFGPALQAAILQWAS